MGSLINLNLIPFSVSPCLPCNRMERQKEQADNLASEWYKRAQLALSKVRGQVGGWLRRHLHACLAAHACLPASSCRGSLLVLLPTTVGRATRSWRARRWPGGSSRRRWRAPWRSR